MVVVTVDSGVIRPSRELQESFQVLFAIYDRNDAKVTKVGPQKAVKARKAPNAHFHFSWWTTVRRVELDVGSIHVSSTTTDMHYRLAGIVFRSEWNCLWYTWFGSGNRKRFVFGILVSFRRNLGVNCSSTPHSHRIICSWGWTCVRWRLQ